MLAVRIVIVREVVEAADPAELAVTHRVLTIMRADEY
jgi:hypothetical protein